MMKPLNCGIALALFLELKQSNSLVYYIGSVGSNILSYNTVVLYSRDRYEIIGLHKSSHSIKQPCSSICLKKVLAMHQSC